MNTYDYKIIDMVRDGSGIVQTVAFTITASDGVDSFTHNYFTALPAPKSDPIDYSDLTETEVIAWVKKLVGDQSQESADAELAAYKLRKSEVKQTGMPWGNN
jgi:hypothetical protein